MVANNFCYIVFRNMLKMSFFLTINLLFVVFGTITAETVTVTLPGGQIMGTTVQSSVTSSRTYWGYYGVRYAEPPTGQYRFLAPAELKPWSGVYDATSEKGVCYYAVSDSSLETEDCLMLNIFSPRNPADPSTDYLPVMFHIHGGGFNQGSGRVNSGFGPDFFMDYDVVVVSINYRLGAFGFLSTGDSVIPGNAGLKDQLLALKWVQSNIKYFGGDPSKVTIFGESAGSASVSYHLLSPQSKGLFQGAIMQSGSALSPWAYQRDMKRFTLLTAGYVNSAFNATGVTSQQLLSNLQSASASSIDAAQAQVQNAGGSDDNQLVQGFFYAPVIEPAGADAFITEKMYGLFESGNYNQVPVMIGTNTDEGLIYYASYTQSMLSGYDYQPSLTVPHDMNAAQGNKDTIGQAIKNQYSPSSTWANNLAGGINFYTDTCFARSLIKQAELQSKFNDVYFYIFGYHGTMGQSSVELAGTNNVTHGEEVPYIFTRINNGINNANLAQFSQADVTTHYRMIQFWTNFAKYQKPVQATNDVITVDWPKVGSNFEYMYIGANLASSTQPKSTIYQFWNNLYSTYSVPPLDTY